MRTLFWESSDDWSAVLNDLRGKGDLDLRVWVGTNPNCDIHVHDFDYNVSGNYQYTGSAIPIYGQLYSHLPIFFDMYWRNFTPSSQRRFNFKPPMEAINQFNILVDRITNLLTSQKIQLMIMARPPHLGADYLMYTISRLLHIKTLILWGVRALSGRLFFVENIESFGDIPKVPVPEDADALWMRYTDRLKNYQHWSVKEFSKVETDRASATNELTQNFPDIESAFHHLLDQKFHNNYEAHAVTDIDFKKHYIYFPLQLQPELSTSCLGGKFSDQLLAIERVASILPPDWHLYVKENPRQTEAGRGDLFFLRLRGIPRCTYVSKNVDSNQLISWSQCVATISGTPGWEALLQGKPVLLFGNAWYKEMPGITLYEDTTTLKDVLGNTFTEEDCRHALAKLLRYSTKEGTHPQQYSTAPISKQENREILVRSISEYLKEKYAPSFTS